MRTEQAKSGSGTPYTGIHWKSWLTKDGETRQLYITYRAAGKQRWEAVPENTVTAAKALRTARMSKVAAGEYLDPDKGKTTLRELADKWYETLTCKPQSRQLYRVLLDRHILPVLGNRELRHLSIEDVEGFARGVQLARPKLALGVLRRILKGGVRWGYLKSSPAEYAERTPDRHRPTKPEPLTPEETRRFLSAVQTHRPEWYAFFLTALSTGMRIGELLAMKWQHVDWTAGTYHVRENLTRRLAFESTKTEGSEGKVSVPGPVLAALRDHKTRQAEERLRSRDWPQPELIFPNTRGKPFDHHTVSAGVLKRLLREAGITRHVRFHDLRHTCASLMIRHGDNIKAVQRQLRHASATLTLDTYGHLYEDDREAAAERMGRALCG